MTQLTPRAFRKRLKDELLIAFEQARYVADQYEWAYRAAHAATVGDEAKVRTVAARPTEAIALHGYLEDNEASDHDRQVRGKAALRRQMDKSVRGAQLAIVKTAGILDGEGRKLEKSMGHLKPGASIRNPRFENPVRGDTTLGKAEMMATLEAQARRMERREHFGG